MKNKCKNLKSRNKILKQKLQDVSDQLLSATQKLYKVCEDPKSEESLIIISAVRSDMMIQDAIWAGSTQDLISSGIKRKIDPDEITPFGARLKDFNYPNIPLKYK